MKTYLSFFILPFILLLSHPAELFSQEAPKAEEITPEEKAERIKAVKEFIGGLKFEKGTINLKDGMATVTLPDNLQYLGPDDTEKVLTQLWGNPPSEEKYLGMIVPGPETLPDPNGWAVIIDYTDDGYVKDDDAEKINYDELLKSMKEANVEENKKRVKEGYTSFDLVGWAEQPHYDKENKKLYWAKEYKFADSNDSNENQLNYSIRILGRKGVLVLNALTSKAQLDLMHAEMPKVLTYVNFNEGHRYADYQPGVDKVAEYGIAALVAGGLLAKTGFFKMLLGLLIAGKKFLVMGVIALIAFGRKFLGKKPKEAQVAASTGPENPGA